MKRWTIRVACVATILALAGCATPPPPPAPTPVPAPTPAPAPMRRPTAPNSAAPNLVIPITDIAGRRMTPNVDLSPDQALWQLRVGLNVAALNCRGPNEAALVADYTRFLNTNRAANARAERWVIADLARRNSNSGIVARDALSTRLYNYFAQPPVSTEFCARATQIMTLAAAEPTATILPFATAKIVELDQPFVDFYARYARYQADMALWQSQQPAPLNPPVSSAVLPPSAARPTTAVPSTAVPPVTVTPTAPVTPAPAATPR